jgi:fructose-1,6-bisphosphatase/inositol monophosphatase family enzyme
MSLNDELLNTLCQRAMDAARAAGELIAAHYQTGVEALHKEAGSSAASQVVTEVDHKAQAAILDLLLPTCEEYDLAMLTEESPDDGSRLQKEAFWSIDPMDGTLAFVNGMAGFAASIALVARDGAPLMGVVYDPVEQSLYHAVRGQGAYRDGKLITVPPLEQGRPLVLRTDFSFQEHPWLEQTRLGLEQIAEEMGLDGAEITYRTGGVMNACGVLQTPNSCYFKYEKHGNSGGSLWDYASTACLYNEVAGAVASDIHGQPMELNRPDSTYMNHHGILFAGHESLARKIVALHKKLAAE